MKALIADGVKLVVLGRAERISDLPEYKRLADTKERRQGVPADTSVDAIARVLDYSPAMKLLVAGEENVLGDPAIRASAVRGARDSLDAVARSVPAAITRIAIRACPVLPPTVEERIADNRAQTVADSVMYREALAAAATARGWSVLWYGRQQVFDDAAKALGRASIDDALLAMGRAAGPPWQASHKLAAAAALAATGGTSDVRRSPPR